MRKQSIHIKTHILQITLQTVDNKPKTQTQKTGKQNKSAAKQKYSKTKKQDCAYGKNAKKKQKQK